jgi:UDP-3-O-[3-hydroxymyristoyl] N-acetylglucosamine deacetylase
LHSGRRVGIRLVPAAPGRGIVFQRTDLGREIPARWDHVADTRLCTVLSLPGEPGVCVGTVEHLMAALAAAEIDDVVVEVDAAELPILDGSAAPFAFLVQSAGASVQAGERLAVEILREVRVAQGEAFAELRPHRNSGAAGLDLSLTIDFASAAIGRQSLGLRLTPEGFLAELAAARTFTLASEVEALRKAGLGKGGSLDNAIVVDERRVLNPEGLRWPDEFVRHKLLDVIGDLALAGAPLVGCFAGNRTGHGLNNKLLRALFADASNYRVIRRGFAGSPLLLPAAAAPV